MPIRRLTVFPNPLASRTVPIASVMRVAAITVVARDSTSATASSDPSAYLLLLPHRRDRSGQTKWLSLRDLLNRVDTTVGFSHGLRSAPPEIQPEVEFWPSDAMSVELPYARPAHFLFS